MAMDTETRAITRGTVEALNGDSLVLRLPHTEYRLHLKSTVPAERLGAYVGKRVSGTIEAVAQRIYSTARGGGGGRFIEPLEGEPRMIAGTVLELGEEDHRVLIGSAAPMWLEPEDEQDLRSLRKGDLINCNVRSGATFAPEVG